VRLFRRLHHDDGGRGVDEYFETIEAVYHAQDPLLCALDPSLRLKNGSGQDDAFTGTAEGDSPHIPLQSLTGWECFPIIRNSDLPRISLCTYKGNNQLWQIMLRR
jgi:hypothetical protein